MLSSTPFSKFLPATSISTPPPVSSRAIPCLYFTFLPLVIEDNYKMTIKKTMIPMTMPAIPPGRKGLEGMITSPEN